MDEGGRDRVCLAVPSDGPLLALYAGDSEGDGALAISSNGMFLLAGERERPDSEAGAARVAPPVETGGG